MERAPYTFIMRLLLLCLLTMSQLAWATPEECLHIKNVLSSWGFLVLEPTKKAMPNHPGPMIICLLSRRSPPPTNSLTEQKIKDWMRFWPLLIVKKASKVRISWPLLSWPTLGEQERPPNLPVVIKSNVGK